MARVTLKSQGELVSFLSAGKAEIRRLKVHFTPKQAGTGDPSPENVREISGWTGVSVTGCGKNLWSPDAFINNGYIDASGTVRSSSPFLHSDYLTFAPGTYHITGINNHNTVAANLRVHGYDGSKQWIRQIASQSKAVNAKWGFSFIVLDTDKYVRISAPAPKESDSEFQLELGSTATTYEPYTGATYSLDWTSNLGTLYGGYVDLISGEVVEEWGIIASYNGESLASEWLSDRDVYVSGTTPTTGAQVVYELATPITHQLTPTEIQTLTGQNNFWSSADSIEVEYDLIETRDTWMHRRHMFALSSPHTESLTGTTLQFTTDMTSKLKECRIHFTPIQEGTGDPSPENVRAIHWWDGIEVTRCGSNLFSGEIYQEGYGINDSGEITENSVYDVYRQLLKPGTYTIIWGDSNTSANKSLRAVNYDANGTVIDIAEYSYKTATNRILVFTVSSQVAITLLSIRSSVVNCRIVNGETDNTVPYEPYTATTLTIPFPQTIYGGYVDLVKGEVVEEYYYATIDGVNNYFSVGAQVSGDYCRAYNFQGNAGGLKNLPKAGGTHYTQLIADAFETRNNVNGSNLVETVQCDDKVNYIRIQLLLSRVGATSSMSANEIYQAINGWLEDSPLHVCYPLATPTTYPIDPVTIRTLKGLNSIWSDANGNIEIKYWTH